MFKKSNVKVAPERMAMVSIVKTVCQYPQCTFFDKNRRAFRPNIAKIFIARYNVPDKSIFSFNSPYSLSQLKYKNLIFKNSLLPGALYNVFPDNVIFLIRYSGLG